MRDRIPTDEPCDHPPVKIEELSPTLVEATCGGVWLASAHRSPSGSWVVWNEEGLVECESQTEAATVVALTCEVLLHGWH